jgi:hypothetical protein
LFEYVVSKEKLHLNLPHSHTYNFMKLYLIFSLFAYIKTGKQQTGTKLAEFCAHAMLTLEVLIHPRALPLVDYVPPNNDTFGEAQFSFGHEYASRNHTTPFSLSQTEPPVSVNNLFADYLANGDDEMGGLWTENTKKTKVSSEMATPLPSSANIQERSEMVPEIATRADVEMRTVENETTFKSDHPGESVMQFQKPVNCTTSTPAGGDIHGDAATDIEPERIVSESAIAHNEANHAESASQSKSSAQSSDTNMLQQVEFKLDYGNSVDDDDDDPFPDIVDGDPNSDSE